MNIAVCGLRDIANGAGGVERGAEELNSRLVRFGHQVSIYARGAEESSRSHRGFQIHTIPFAGGKYLCYGTYMHRAVRRIHADLGGQGLIHLHSPAVHGIWALTFKRLGYRVITHTHGIEWRATKWPYWFKPAMRVSELIGVRCSDAVLCVSPHEHEYYSRRVVNGRCVLVPNGIAVRPRESNGDILDKYGLEPGTYYLCVGRLVPQKCMMELVTAFSLADSQKKLVIVGSSSFSDDYATRVLDLARDVPSVVFTGWLDKAAVQGLYDECFAFVLLSQHEGCPNVLLEAISSGCVCIVSDIPAHRDIAPEGLLYVPVGDVRRTAEVFGKLENSNTYYAKCRLRVKDISNLPTWDQAADIVNTLYVDIAGW